MEKDLRSQDTGQSLPFVTTSGGRPPDRASAVEAKTKLKHILEKNHIPFFLNLFYWTPCKAGLFPKGILCLNETFKRLKKKNTPPQTPSLRALITYVFNLYKWLKKKQGISRKNETWRIKRVKNNTAFFLGTPPLKCWCLFGYSFHSRGVAFHLRG